MRRTPCLLALALSLGVAAAPAPAGASTGTSSTGTSSTVTGVVREVVVEHPGRSGADDVRKILVTGGRSVALPEDALPGNTAGDTVEVVLRADPDGVAAVSRSRTLLRASARGPGAATGPSTTDPAVHEVYVAVVDPRGAGGVLAPGAAATAAALVEQASDYWSSQTGGRVRFEVAHTLAPYTSAYSCGTDVGPDGKEADSTVLMWNEALDRFDEQLGAGAAYGVDKHLLVVLPDGEYRRGCDYGLGTVGSLHEDGHAVLVSDSNPSLYAHEFGHNLGLHHSNALHCDTPDAEPTSTAGSRTTWPSRCFGEDYGDLLDVMGYSGDGYGEGNLNGVHLDRMRLSTSAVRTITGNTTTAVQLVPLSSTGTGSRTVAVTDALGSRYYAEYRTATGRDAVSQGLDVGNGPPSLGVRILREDPALRNGSYVLDASPTGADYDYDTALPVGATFRTVTGTVTFRVTAAGASGATVVVRRAVPPATVALEVPSRAAAGSAVTSTATVADARGGPVAAWPVTLQVRTGSAAWVTADTATTGSTGTATFSYRNGTTGTYRAVTRAATGAPTRTSATALTTSSAAPTLAAPRSSVASGSRLTTTGTLRGVPDRVVHLQARLGQGAWTTRARAVRDGSTFTAATRLTARGTWQLRYAARADPAGRYTAGRSAPRTVVVR